ncbi:LPXTG cell wall anchor domain-containing protein [Apilactobacillus kunkeei]|uniref:LPXTG cell wall anchor domain-containing protein n=1 Tax=Apilactobacillus kunkeei TaxID=148814 RepID=UPI00200B2BEE|nr:LPXTG cell wall anchor domain-containing protein [Apilactobacillus kunkeei]MCK8619851.1 LPXTG cell wall anchor domain-containing protein [Apilactobacillus kunkeei]
MSREVKEKKILHKVKKKWVVIGMSTVALLGTGYVVSQDNNITPAAVVAHADEQNSSYQADPNNVSATVTNVDASTQNVTAGKSVNYEVSLNNNDNLGRVIPKGTKITFTVNPQSGKNFSDLFSSISTYTKYGNANVFDVSTNDNVVTLTTNTDLYPSDSKINVSLLVKEGPQDAPDSTYDATVSASMNYAGENSNISVSNGNISVLQKKKSDVRPVDSQAGQMGARPLNIPDNSKPDTPSNWNTYPDDVSDYPLSNTYKNLVQYSGDTANAGYAPIVANKDGKPYFVVVAELNPNSKGNTVHGRAITLLNRNADKSSFDTNNFRLYAIVDGKYKDITNEPGVYLKSEYGNPMFDYSASKYTDNTVDFVAYLTYSDLSINYGVDGYLKYTVGDDPTINNVPPMHANVSIVPASDNVGKSWIISPDTTVYTDKDGNYTYNSGSLTNGVNVFQAIDGTPAKYVHVDNPKLNVSNDEGVNDGQTINVAQQSTKDINLTYSADGAVNSSAKLHVINPYVSIPDQQVTRNVKVNYIDSVTGNVLRTDTGSSVFKASGLKDTRNNEVTWGNWSNVSGDGTYNFTVPTIDGYVPEDNSNVTGQLYPLGNDVTRTVYMDPTTTVQQNIVDTLVIDHIDNSTKQKIAPDYERDYTFVQTGTKNERTGVIKWNDSYSPDSYSYSVESPKIDGYELTDPNQLYVTGTIDGDADFTGTTVGYTKVATPSSSAAQSSSAEPSSSAASSSSAESSSSAAQSSSAEPSSSATQSSSAESSAQSSSAESSAQSSSAESSAQSSSAESSAQSSSAESSAQSSSAESSAQSSSAESSSQSSSAESSAQSSSAESSAQSSSAESSAQSNSAESSASSHVVVPSTSSASHGNNDISASTAANKDKKRLPQTGDQTHENTLVAIGTALIAMALGLVFFASRRRRK